MWTGGTSADSPRVYGFARPIRAVPKADIRCVRGVEIGNVTRQMLLEHVCRRSLYAELGTDRLQRKSSICSIAINSLAPNSPLPPRSHALRCAHSML